MQLIELGDTRVVTVAPSDSIDRAISLLEENDFRHLPVVDRGQILGMVSDRDLLSAVGMQHDEERLSSSPGSGRVGATRIDQIMSTPARTAAAEDSLQHGAQLMLDAGIRAIPLVYRDRLAGIVTETDFLKCYLNDRPICKMQGWRLQLVRDHMTPNVKTLKPTDGFLHAARMMHSHRFRHIPIVDGGMLIGIVSDRDMRRFLGTMEIDSAEEAGMPARARGHVTMRDVMTTDVTNTTVDATLAEVAEVLVKRKFGSLPVVDDGELKGIITEADLLRHVVNACREGEVK